MIAWRSCYYSSAYSLLAKVSPLSRNRTIETLIHHARPPASSSCFRHSARRLERVRGNRGCAGGEGETLEQFEINLDTNLAALRNEVVQGSYEPRPLLRVVVESAGKKPRRLAVPAVRDRVLQTAVAMVLTPLFEAELEDCSFAYRLVREVAELVQDVGIIRSDQGMAQSTDHGP